MEECKECGKTFTSPSKFKRHLSTKQHKLHLKHFNIYKSEICTKAVDKSWCGYDARKSDDFCHDDDVESEDCDVEDCDVMDHDDSNQTDYDDSTSDDFENCDDDKVELFHPFESKLHAALYIYFSSLRPVCEEDLKFVCEVMKEISPNALNY